MSCPGEAAGQTFWRAEGHLLRHSSSSSLPEMLPKAFPRFPLPSSPGRPRSLTPPLANAEPGPVGGENRHRPGIAPVHTRSCRGLQQHLSKGRFYGVNNQRHPIWNKGPTSEEFQTTGKNPTACFPHSGPHRVPQPALTWTPPPMCKHLSKPLHVHFSNAWHSPKDE